MCRRCHIDGIHQHPWGHPAVAHKRARCRSPIAHGFVPVLTDGNTFAQRRTRSFVVLLDVGQTPSLAALEEVSVQLNTRQENVRRGRLCAALPCAAEVRAGKPTVITIRRIDIPIGRVGFDLIGRPLRCFSSAEYVPCKPAGKRSCTRSAESSHFHTPGLTDSPYQKLSIRI